MKIIKTVILALATVSIFTACNQNKTEEKVVQTETAAKTEKPMQMKTEMGLDKRVSLELNAMQKNHQKTIMRDHLDAVQNIITLLSSDKYKEASKLAYERLGSTTKMRLMCASFGDKNFENLGLEFHKSADKMSEIFKTRNKEQSLKALSNTMNYCVQCHATYQQ